MLPRISPQPPKTPPWEPIDIVLVGVAAEEDGQLLDLLLQEAGINRSLLYITNVFLLEGDTEQFFVNPSVSSDYIDKYPSYNDSYLRKEFLSELERLTSEISMIKPKVLVAFGEVAFWAFTGIGRNLKNERGSMYSSSLVPTMTVFPTYHPSYILENETELNTVINDLKKAKEYAEKN